MVTNMNRESGLMLHLGVVVLLFVASGCAALIGAEEPIEGDPNGGGASLGGAAGTAGSAGAGG